jgi:predicted transcriptional regulator
VRIPACAELREARKDRGVSQRELAERAGVSQPLISRIENEDVDPRLSTLHRIAAAINQEEHIADDETVEVAVRDAVRRQREAERLTQGEVAEQAGVSQPLIARIEGHDVDPRASPFRSILDVFEGFSSADTQRADPGGGQSIDDTSANVSSDELPTERSESILQEIEASFEKV